MAQTTQDTTLFSESTGKELKGQAVESEGGGGEVQVTQQMAEGPSSTPSVAGADAQTEKAPLQTSTDGHLNEPQSRPSLVPLGSTQTHTSTLTPVAPHPKRFSAVNINKKFLEKNTTSGSAGTSSSSSAAKSGSPSTRPSVQPVSSHSRLVTAKLTASSAVASSTAGWSRPSSVTPSPATNSPISTSPLPTAPASQPSTTSAPQLPHAGKVILPQPRAAMTQLVSSQKEGTALKPVWGNVKPTSSVSIRTDIQPDDFPTAAEVAQSTTNAARKQAKADEAKASSDTAAKQLRSEEADTFRGVHLDPNAHHWDEMEEDDDNFLDGVIEFGDGRQYKIESNDAQSSSSSPPRNVPPPRSQAVEQALKDQPFVPVSKEDRFVDDFDRSWPKSRTSPATAPRDMPSPVVQQPVPPSISPANHATQDSSRVLFNERSNRLEPYAQSHPPGQGPFVAKRPGHPESSSPTEPRSSRPGHPVMVLQKPIVSDPRSRRYSGSNGGFNAGPANGFGDRSRRDGPPPSPRMTRDPPPHAIDSHAGPRDYDHHGDRGRRTTMGPPPIPPHAMRQEGRQLPPHLAQISPDAPTRRLPSRDSRFSPLDAPSVLPPSTSARIPPQSPALSHASLSLVSPAAAPTLPLPALSAPELDEVRKDVMHSAAERAKQRRQQEEAEREAQKERARRKAADIEEKLKAAELAKQKEKEEKEALEAARLAKEKQEKEAVFLIEEAVKSVDATKNIDEKRGDSKAPTTPTQNRPAAPKLMKPPGIFSRSGPSVASPVAPSMQTESWRTRTTPTLPPPATPRQIQVRPPTTATNFVDSGPSASEQVETIADGAKGDLEVVDFSEMDKFVGVSETTASVPSAAAEGKTASSTLTKTPRPVAADFFDEPTSMQDSVPPSKQADFGAWRRKVSQDIKEPVAPLSITDSKVETLDNVKKATPQPATPSQDRVSPSKEHARPSASPERSTISPNREPSHHTDISQVVQVVQTSPVVNAQRTPRAQTFYKEAAMSALDDAMSRIKGVLVGMHAQEPAKESTSSNSPIQEVQQSRTTHVVQLPTPQAPLRSVPKDRWVPPALRPRRFDEHDEPRENFLFTIPHLPHSPDLKPSVKLPTLSSPVEFIYKKQLQAFWRPPLQARMDILSFDPPVHDMNRRDLSLNDVLFRRAPLGYKGKPKYRVLIPRMRGPKVSIPTAGLSKPNGTGAFGRPTHADGAATWRKPAASPSARTDFEADTTELKTQSRSPPPNHTPPTSTVALIPKSNDNSPTKSDTTTTSRSRTQPRMPEGSAVAFIRDSRIDVVEADTKPLVNFIFGSQLDESKPSAEIGTTVPTGDAVSGNKAPKVTVNGVTALSSAPEKEQPRATSYESKTPDDSTERVIATPPMQHASATWTRSSLSLSAKESPARPPDPEHLKAVWSQTSNKAGLHPVNSLEGIADDLTALPFTLQDVKSEDGETPPPLLPSAPSRMSIHDVTRAFQTVPTSSSTSTQPLRASFSPPSTQAPVARPTTAPYGYSPVLPNNMRPAYVPYPSPMISHSPAPVMYGHPMVSSPVPSRMQVNGHTPLYSQPMWVTMPGPSQANMMRPPYPGQMMAYASPGYGQPPNVMPVAPQTQNGGRGRGMPIMSPVMPHAHAHPGPPMYAGSPVMLHAVQVPQNHSFAGRGQPRADNGQMSSQQQHIVHPSVAHSGFNAGPPSPFVRSQW